MNAVIYSRVSTHEQAEKDLSIPAQLTAMREYARTRSWTILEEFEEPGVSAKTADRPALQRLLARVTTGIPKIDVVVVHKVDRWARKLRDHLMIQTQLSQAGVRLASATENLEDSAPGRLVEHMLASFAEFYSDNLASEVKKGMRQKVLKGGWPHRPPRGYIAVRDAKTDTSRVEEHPTDGLLVRKAFDLYATGWFSLKNLAARLARDGLATGHGSPLAAQQVKELLSNPFYLGRVKWKDIDAAGQHDPLVSQELFDKVQAVLRRRSKEPGAKGSVRGFVLRGLAICASCRGHMTGSRARGRWLYYQCSRRNYSHSRCDGQKYCPAGRAHTAIESICERLEITPELEQAIIAAADVRIQTEHLTTDQLARLRAQRADLAEQENRLTASFAAGSIAPNSYRSRVDKLHADQEHIDALALRARQAPVALLRKVGDMLGQAKTISALKSIASESQRVTLLRAVFQTIVLDGDGVVSVVLRKPFDALFTRAVGDGLVENGATTVPFDAEALAETLVQCAQIPPAEPARTTSTAVQ